MTKNTGKWLCLGGSESGKWIEQKIFHEVYPFNNSPMRPHIYHPKQLVNPQTNQSETFYVFTELNEDRYDFALNHALTTSSRG